MYRKNKVSGHERVEDGTLYCTPVLRDNEPPDGCFAQLMAELNGDNSVAAFSSSAVSCVVIFQQMSNTLDGIKMLLPMKFQIA